MTIRRNLRSPYMPRGSKPKWVNQTFRVTEAEAKHFKRAAAKAKQSTAAWATAALIAAADEVLGIQEKAS